MTGFAGKMGQTPHGWCQVSLCKRQAGGQTHFSGKAGVTLFIVQRRGKPAVVASRTATVFLDSR